MTSQPILEDVPVFVLRASATSTTVARHQVGSSSLPVQLLKLTDGDIVAAAHHTVDGVITYSLTPAARPPRQDDRLAAIGWVDLDHGRHRLAAARIARVLAAGFGHRTLADLSAAAGTTLLPHQAAAATQAAVWAVSAGTAIDETSTPAPVLALYRHLLAGPPVAAASVSATVFATADQSLALVSLQSR